MANPKRCMCGRVFRSNPALWGHIGRRARTGGGPLHQPVNLTHEPQPMDALSELEDDFKRRVFALAQRYGRTVTEYSVRVVLSDETSKEAPSWTY